MKHKIKTPKIECALKEALIAAFAPADVVVTNQSHKHRNHQEAQKHGGGHFDVTVMSEVFTGQTKIARHRLIYAALKPFFTRGKIHALAIKANTPAEVNTMHIKSSTHA